MRFSLPALMPVTILQTTVRRSQQLILIAFKTQLQVLYTFPGATGVKLPNHDYLHNNTLRTAYFLLYQYLQYMDLSPWWATPLGAVPLTPRGALFVPREIVSGSASYSIV